MSILALVIVGLAAFGITQWDNIQAAVIGLKYSQEEIDQMQNDVKTAFANKAGIDLDAVEEMASQITPEGDPIEPEDVAVPKESQSETSVSADDTPSKPAGRTSGKPTASEPSDQVQRDTSEVEAILARFYSMKSSYVSQLDGIRSSASAEYRALPKEKKGTEAIIRIGRSAIGRASTLESECDAKMNARLAELCDALQKAGLDQSLANDVKYHYASEKSLLKAQLMSKYKKYLS